MKKELTPVDISHVPELVRLALEVRRSKEPRVLRKEGEDVAILMPPTASAGRRRKARHKAEADLAAFWSSFGGWKDVDTDTLIEDIYESRRISTRPPVEL